MVNYEGGNVIHDNRNNLGEIFSDKWKYVGNTISLTHGLKN